jgi:hypothetical protein
LRTDEEADDVIIQLCIAGDLVRLRRHLGRTDRRVGAGPLCAAASYGKLDVVRCLVEEYGANIKEIFDDCYTPLIVATQKGQLALLDYMAKELGAGPASTRQGTMDAHLYSSQRKLGTWLWRYASERILVQTFTKSANDGFLPLHMAAQNGNIDMLRCLVKELGACVDQANNNQEITFLYMAAQNGQLDVVKCLVKDLGADVNKGQLQGSIVRLLLLLRPETSMTLAVVRWLLKNGANAQMKHNEFFTAADVSRYYGAPAEATARVPRGQNALRKGWLQRRRTQEMRQLPCLEVFFCSKECQVARWPVDKADCKQRVGAKAGKEK